MGLTFYYAPMTSATRVHWALEELGIPYEKVRVDLKAGEQRRAEYLKMNPNGKVPLLVIDGQPMFESMAILIWLGETYGVEKGLYPKPGPDRVPALQWIAWATATLLDGGSRFMRNSGDRFPVEERNAKAAETATRDLGTYLGILDAHLRGREYLLGGSFTLVDVSLATLVAFLGRLGFDLAAYGNVTAWLGRCTSRPALARALAG